MNFRVCIGYIHKSNCLRRCRAPSTKSESSTKRHQASWLQAYHRTAEEMETRPHSYSVLLVCLLSIPRQVRTDVKRWRPLKIKSRGKVSSGAQPHPFECEFLPVSSLCQLVSRCVSSPVGLQSPKREAFLRPSPGPPLVERPHSTRFPRLPPSPLLPRRPSLPKPTSSP